MGQALALREDFDGSDLRCFALCEPGCGSDAAPIGACGDLRWWKPWGSRRDRWVSGGRLCGTGSNGSNAEGPDGLITRKAPGSAAKLDAAKRAELARIVERGPDPEVDGVVRWRLSDLAGWVWNSFGIQLSRGDAESGVEGARLRQALGPGRAITAQGPRRDRRF